MYNNVSYVPDTKQPNILVEYFINIIKRRHKVPCALNIDRCILGYNRNAP